MASVFFNSSLTTDLQQLDVGQPIIFKADVNEGNLYDETTGIFEAHLKGWYCFSVAVGTKSVDTPAVVCLEINSSPMAKVVTDIPSSTAPIVISQASNQAIVYMRPSDKARVVGCHHNCGPIAGGGHTTFTGYLLHPQ